MTENNEHIINRTAYSETKGTGVLSKFIFSLLLPFILFFIAYFNG